LDMTILSYNPSKSMNNLKLKTTVVGLLSFYVFSPIRR